MEDTVLLDSGTLFVLKDEPEPKENGTKKKANELDGKTWTKNSISIWSDLRKTPEEASLGHPAMFPMALVSRIIESFTTSKDTTVFDPFAGSGTTLLAAKKAGKHGFGTELSKDFFDLAKRRCNQQSLWEIEEGSATVYHQDAREASQHITQGSVDLVVTSPPYWDILNERRSADNKEIRNYGNYDNDLGAITDYRSFLDSLKEVFVEVFRLMRPGAYCAVVVMDIRKKDKFYPFHSDVATLMQEIGFIYDDIIIWDRRHEYNNMRPLGYPAVFRVNKAHEFILLFQKPSK